MDEVLDKFLTTASSNTLHRLGRAQLLSPRRNPCGIHITGNYKKLNKLTILGQLPIRRFDEVFDKLGTGRTFSLFDLVSSFHPITVHKDTIHLTASCTPMRLFDWLLMPQGSSAAPGWYVKVINEVIEGLGRVAAYLDDVFVSDADPSRHVANMKEFFLRLRNQNLKLSPSKANTGTTNVDFSVTPSLPPASCRIHKRWKRR